MSGRFETFELIVGSSGSGLAVPGRIQRLLFNTLGIRAEEIGAIEPMERGRTRVEIALARSRGIATPLVLPLVERAQTSLWELRRFTDPSVEGVQTWILSTEGGDYPSPGQVANALNAAFPTQVGAEDLGLSFAGGGWVRVEVPERLAAFTAPPKTLAIGKKKFKLEVLR